MNDCYVNRIKRLALAALASFTCGLVFCQSPKRPPVTGIACVQLQVSELKTATTFYGSLLGYSLVRSPLNKRSVIIRVNPRQSIAIQDGLPPGQDERLFGISFQTTDAAAMRVYLQSAGISVPAALSTEDGQLSFTIQDPDKHVIKFTQSIAGDQPKRANPFSGNEISRRILHAGLTITDAKAANNFYAGILGFSEIWRGGASDSITNWINMRVPEGTDYLEYMLVSGPVGRQQLGSLHHIALMVPDMQQAVDVLSSRSISNGYPVAAPRIGRNNRWQLNLFDPDGTRIELMEPFPMR
ncbi:MAG: VOC family protein [Chitinophagaceae bacterium]